MGDVGVDVAMVLLGTPLCRPGAIVVMMLA